MHADLLGQGIADFFRILNARALDRFEQLLRNTHEILLRLGDLLFRGDDDRVLGLRPDA
ncbi:MAG: hypothetical protein ACR2QH_01680 [Geminicoccaceae bacterium]